MAEAATAAEKRIAAQRGLAYLYKTQHPAGYWGSSGNEEAATAAAAFAFLSQRESWDNDAAQYQAAADKAIAYLLSGAKTMDVSARDDGADICPGAAGSCTGVFWYGNGESIYATALAAAAIATYGTAVGPDVIATATGPLAGMTWAQIAQGITNTLAAKQNASNTTNRGGWHEFIRGYGDSELSATPWAVTALLYNQTLGAVTPQVVKDDLKTWLTTAQGASVPACRQPDSAGCSHADVGGWLLGMKFVGYDLTNWQIQAALAFLNKTWQSSANGVSYGNFGHPYAMWAIYKGLQTTVGLTDHTIGNLLTDCGAAVGPSDGSGCTWAEDYNDWLIKNQKADGSWDGYSYWTEPVATALYVSILSGTRIPTGTYACPASGGLWAADATWPVASLRLGGQTYTKPELLALLNTPTASGMPADASLLLANELIVAKLNIARGSDPAPAAGAIADADRLLRASSARLPFRIAPASPVGARMAERAKALQAYNDGSLTPACTAAQLSETSTRQTQPASHAQDLTPRMASDRSSAVAATATANQDPKSAVLSKRVRTRVRKGVTSLAVNTDGTALASASTDNRIRLWSSSTGLQRLALPASAGLPLGVTFSPVGSTLSSIGRDSFVRVWDAVSGTALATLAGHEQAIRALSASPDGKFVGSAGEETRIMLWDLGTRKLSKILYGPTNFVNGLSFSPDSRLLASAGEDARVLIFEVASGKLLYTLRGHSGPIDTVAFSPDGTLLASAGQDTVIHVWDPAVGVQRQALAGHSQPVRTIAFSPDSGLIASGGEDTKILLWNAKTGVLQKTLSGSLGSINALVFDPKGRFLASASDAGDITIWNVNSGAKLLTITVPTAP
jgi:hypothetical protein